MIVKNSRRVDFYTHVLATRSEDSSSRRRIWRYGERSFPSMRTASFRGFFTSGRRSRGRRSDLLKLPNVSKSKIFFVFVTIVTQLIKNLYCIYTRLTRIINNHWTNISGSYPRKNLPNSAQCNIIKIINWFWVHFTRWAKWSGCLVFFPLWEP